MKVKASVKKICNNSKLFVERAEFELFVARIKNINNVKVSLDFN